ncbi:hypothetical protein [Luteitalea sp.]
MGNALAEAHAEIARLRAWVADLQSGLVLNCVYCGHAYGPVSTPTPRELLDAHVRTCPKHPLAGLRRAVRRYLHAEIRRAAAATASRACDARAAHKTTAGLPRVGAVRLANEVNDLRWFSETARDGAWADLVRLSVEPAHA